MAIELRGERVKLRALRKADVASICAHARDREISQYTFIPHPYRKEHAEQFLMMSKKWERKGLARHLGIEWLGTGEIIGVVGLFDMDKRNHRTEIGYWLGKKYWGQGIAAEAVGLMLRYCFRELKFNRLYAHVFVGNTASERLLLRLGFQWEGLERASRRRRGRWFDSILYAMLKEEYHPSRKVSSHSRALVRK